MVVTFNPEVQVKEIDVSYDEHVREVKNPQNTLDIVCDTCITGGTEPDSSISINFILIIILLVIIIAVALKYAAKRRRPSADSHE